MLRLCVLSAAPVLVALATPAAAQDLRLEGFWNLDFRDVPPPADMVERLPPDTALLADTGVVEFGRGEFGGLRPLPEAEAKARAWQPTDDMALNRVCLAPSVIYSIQGPFPFEIHMADRFIVFRYEYFDQVRLIFMDGRGHPGPEAPHSRMGHSIGRWEGKELVIETSHILPSTITNNGLDHSADIRMVERYRLSDDGAVLEAMQWFTDPQVLENHGARYIRWNRQGKGYVYPYDCDPTFALEYQQLEMPVPAED